MEKKKIVFLPLDERPCNYNFPKDLLEDNDEYELLMPSNIHLGYKKKPAELGIIDEFLLENSKKADIAILSIDMLLYGGLLNGRIHQYSLDFLERRLDIIKKMKMQNTKLKIYAFHLIMRCPRYSSSDEEPEYYEKCGKEIFLLGEYLHKKELDIISNDELQKINDLQNITSNYINDYLKRREINISLNFKVIDLVEKYIDYLIIPQDDSSLYGYVAKDQNKIREYVSLSHKQKYVSIYPGADEVGLTLLARAIQIDKNVRLKIRTEYSSCNAFSLVPLYEDRILGESVKCQIQAANCISCDDADIYLMVNAPSSQMLESNMQNKAVCAYNVNRSLSVFLDKIDYLINNGKKVALADVAYANGGDLKLAILLDDYGITDKILSYAGWNTSGNTLGTTIACAVISTLFSSSKLNKFNALRFFEDVGFCSHTREEISKQLAELGCTYFDLKDKNDSISLMVKTETESFIRKIMPNFSSKYYIKKCTMPWNRMFEVDFDIEEKD